MIRVGGLCAFKTTGFSSNRHMTPLKLAASNSDFLELAETKCMTGSPCSYGQITFRWLGGTRDHMLIHGFVALHIWMYFLNFYIAAWFLHLTVYAQRMMYVVSLCPISYMHEVKLYSGNEASGTLLLTHSSPQLHTPLGTNTSNISLPLISTLF